MKTRLLLVALFSTGLLLHSQSTTSIPDDNFENYLETHNANGQIDTYPNTMGDGVMGNNIVETAKISSVTTLNVINLGIMSLSGIEDNLIDFITIYPNPFKDVLYIKSNSDSSYQLFDLIGRQLSQGYFRQGTNNITTSSLAPGTFLLKLNSKTSSITKKKIKSL